MLFSEKNVYDIMSPKEKQAAAQQTFVFHGPLTKVSPAQQAVERVSAGDLSIRYNEPQRKTSGCAADICFSWAINEGLACAAGSRARQRVSMSDALRMH